MGLSQASLAAGMRANGRGGSRILQNTVSGGLWNEQWLKELSSVSGAVEEEGPSLLGLPVASLYRHSPTGNYGMTSRC